MSWNGRHFLLQSLFQEQQLSSIKKAEVCYVWEKTALAQEAFEDCATYHSYTET